jgi:hypothetical protein
MSAPPAISVCGQSRRGVILERETTPREPLRGCRLTFDRRPAGPPYGLRRTPPRSGTSRLPASLAAPPLSAPVAPTPGRPGPSSLSGHPWPPILPATQRADDHGGPKRYAVPKARGARNIRSPRATRPPVAGRATRPRHSAAPVTSPRPRAPQRANDPGRPLGPPGPATRKRPRTPAAPRPQPDLPLPSSISDRPVIASGCSIPRTSSTVGATSASTPLRSDSPATVNTTETGSANVRCWGSRRARACGRHCRDRP